MDGAAGSRRGWPASGVRAGRPRRDPRRQRRALDRRVPRHAADRRASPCRSTRPTSRAQVRTVLDNSGARVLFTTPKYLDTAHGRGARRRRDAPRLVLLSGDAPGIADAADLAAPAPRPPIAIVAATRRRRHPLHVRHDGRSQGRRPDARAISTPSGSRRFAIVHGHRDATRCSACCRSSTRWRRWRICCCRSRSARASCFSRPSARRRCSSALSTRGITIFACVPQFFYLIHQRVDGGGRASAARSRARSSARSSPPTSGCAITPALNPGRRVFARVHRALGPTMRLLVTGGSKFDPAIGRDLYGMGFTMLNAYGLTETSGGATIVRPGDRFTTSVGQPFPGVEIKIARERRPPTTTADDGEILIRGPIVMREYFNRPDATAEALAGRLAAHRRPRPARRRRPRSTSPAARKRSSSSAPARICIRRRSKRTTGSRRSSRSCACSASARPGEPAAERLHAVIVPDEQVLRERGIVNLRELMRFELERPVGPAAGAQAHPELRHLARAAAAHDDRQDQAAGDRAAGARARRPTRRADDAAAHRRRARVAGRAGARAPDWRPRSRARSIDATVPPDANLELDLGLDSMERVELLTRARAAARHARHAPRRARRSSRVRAARRRGAGRASASTDAGRGPDDAGEPAVGRRARGSRRIRRSSPTSTQPKPVARDARVRRARPGRARAARAAAASARAGSEHLPPAGPFILSPNHQAYLDGFFVAAALPFRTLRRAVLRRRRGVLRDAVHARGSRALVNIVPVDPDANLVNAMQAGATGLRLKQGAGAVSRGRAIDRRRAQEVPQGRGDPLGAPGRADRAGRARRAVRSLAARPAVQLARAAAVARRRRSRVQFGAPIPVARGDYAGGTQALRDAVEKMLEMRSKCRGEYGDQS